MRGRQFGFLATLSSAWIAARVGFLAILPKDAAPMANIALPTQEAMSVIDAISASLKPAITQSPSRTANDVFVSAPRQFQPVAQDSGGLVSSVDPFVGNFERPATRSPLVSTLQPLAVINGKNPWSVYAYSFFRDGEQVGGGIGGGQYGGSQSGFVGTYGLHGDTQIAVLLRGAIAHGNTNEREIGAGLRWQPARNIPITLTAERRFRNARADAFAVYVAGGVSRANLPLDFRLDAFAQGGLVSGKDGGAFFDMTGRAERRLATFGKTPVTLGAGIWGGGQKGIFRIDAGPTFGTEIRLGPANVRVNADWRFRIAGDARPASGPALTLSTSF